MMNKEILEKAQSEEDYGVKISFEVICQSDTSMSDGDTIKERILNYIDQCDDAMDDSMRHWGEHTHCIDPVKVEIYDENEDTEVLIDVTNEVLGEVNPDAISYMVEDSIKLLKKCVITLNKNVPELMDMPKELPSRTKIDYGKNLHDYEPRYGDPKYWIYPEGIEEKIEDNKLYKVWYTSRDTADPADSTIWNYVKYICYIPIEKNDLRKEIENILKLL